MGEVRVTDVCIYGNLQLISTTNGRLNNMFILVMILEVGLENYCHMFVGQPNFENGCVTTE
jgi:hypothetical protein